jgi:hypothetical protein
MCRISVVNDEASPTTEQINVAYSLAPHSTTKGSEPTDSLRSLLSIAVLISSNSNYRYFFQVEVYLLFQVFTESDELTCSILVGRKGDPLATIFSHFWSQLDQATWKNRKNCLSQLLQQERNNYGIGLWKNASTKNRNRILG